MAVPIVPAAVAVAKNILMDAAKEVFGQAGRGVAGLSETGPFLAGPRPTGPISGFRHDVGRATCDRWARGGRESLLPGADMVYREVCEPYLGPNMPGAPNTGPPFNGGQCPDTRYLFTWERLQDGISLGTSSFDAVGPLAVVKQAGSEGESSSCPSGQSFSKILMTNRDAPVTLNSGCNVSIRNLQVSPLFGGRDNCGDPPPEFDSGEPNPSPDPNPGPVPGPPGYPFPDININVEPNGDITIDVGDGEPPVVISPGAPDSTDAAAGNPGPQPEVAPPIDVPSGGGGGGGGGVGGDTPFGEPPEGRIWVGAYVRLNGDLAAFGVVPGSRPGNGALPVVVGNASLVVSDPTSGVIRTTATQLRSEWSAHLSGIAGIRVTGIRVNLNPILGYTVYKVSILDPNKPEAT